jgi:hypothetical protein
MHNAWMKRVLLGMELLQPQAIFSLQPAVECAWTYRNGMTAGAGPGIVGATKGARLKQLQTTCLQQAVCKKECN